MSSIKTYWDHTEKERSELSEEEVKALLDLHLMEKGVLKVKAPVLATIKDEPVLPKVKVFKVSDSYSHGVAFETIEQAQAFCDLKPLKLDYDYSMGDRYMRADPLECKISQVDVFERGALLTAASLLKEIKAAKEANEKAERVFADENKKVESCLSEVWSDYWEQKHTGERHNKLIATWNEYLKMTGNDEKIASGFLKKAFTVETINEASEWTGVEIPTNFIEQRAAEAVPYSADKQASSKEEVII